MKHQFFSRSADTVVAVALAAVIVYVVVAVGPVALARWF